ncbi:MAG: BACON domain-containing carbohydrate-binding protein [Bacteroidales bacterium]|jgi:thiol-disulfide isomerase/thioredoxin
MKTSNIKSILLIAGLSLTLFSSCNRSDQTGYLVVAPVSLNMPPVTTTRTVTVRSSESWFIEQIGNEDWCTVYPDKGTPGETQITVTVTPMPDALPRIALFSVTSVSGLEKFLEVEQTDEAGSNYFLEFYGDPNPSMLVYPRDVAPVKFLINTNTPSWNVFVSDDAREWLTAERKEDTLLVNISDIDRPEGREGTVTASAGGSISASISFSQMGLHDFLAPTTDFTLSVPGIPDSDLAFSYVYRRARITMLYMSASWCPDCTNFLPKVKELFEEFSPHGFKIYGVFMETEGREQEYYDYVNNNGLNDVDEATGNKIWWEFRPVFNSLEERKVNDFTRLFYGDALLTGEVNNFFPAFFFVDGGGNIRKVYVDNYVLRTDAAISSLYRNMRTYLSRQLECCGG